MIHQNSTMQRKRSHEEPYGEKFTLNEWWVLHWSIDLSPVCCNADSGTSQAFIDALGFLAACSIESVSPTPLRTSSLYFFECDSRWWTLMFKVPPSVACWLEEILFQYERSWQEAGQLNSFEEWGAAFLITPKVVVQMFHFVTHLSLCQKQEQTKGYTQCALMLTLKMNKDYATKQTEQLTSCSFMSREPARVCTFTETASRGYGWLAVRSPPPAPTHLIAVATDQFELWLLLTKKKKKVARVDFQGRTHAAKR